MSEAQTQAQAPEATELNLQDLVAIRSVIDVATQRGAFKANELVAVGTVYNKLAGFLDAVAKQNQAAAEAAQAEAAPAEAPTQGA